jgi:hypothetical protein
MLMHPRITEDREHEIHGLQHINFHNWNKQAEQDLVKLSSSVSTTGNSVLRIRDQASVTLLAWIPRGFSCNLPTSGRVNVTNFSSATATILDNRISEAIGYIQNITNDLKIAKEEDLEDLSLDEINAIPLVAPIAVSTVETKLNKIEEGRFDHSSLEKIFSYLDD